MSSFKEVGNSIGNYNKWKKIRRVIIIIVLIVLFMNRKNIMEKYHAIQNSISSFFSEMGSISNDNKKEEEITIQLSEDNIENRNLIEISYVDTTSSLISSKGIEYVGDNLKDGDLTTTWQEAKDDFGEGEEITLGFEPNKNVRYIAIYNGKQSSEKEFKQNNRLKEIEILIKGHATLVELKDTMVPQIIEISGIDKVSNIVIKIISVYEGTKYDDTVVSEIQCY